MPFVQLFSNQPDSTFNDEFDEQLTILLGNLLDKEPSRVNLLIVPNCRLTLGGDRSCKSIWLTIANCGVFEDRQVQIISREITKFLEEKTDINRECICIQFHDMAACKIARGGITLAERKAGLK
uniref:Macrophage migration inhibitory factor n=1 Tax=Rhabditophanes sp. KR3021 TaxID=114890 RepID=A0AC35U6V2_9BILA